jgi:uncharacterized protein (DUF433 family)
MLLEREGVGFELGDSLRAQFGSLRSETIAAPRTSQCDIIERGERLAVSQLVQRWRLAGLAVDELRLVHDFDWLAAEAMNTALVPAQAVQFLSELVTGWA